MSFGEALEQSKMRREEDEKKDREVAAAKKLTKNQAAEKSKILKEGGFMRFMSRNDPDKAQFDDLLSPLLKETREF